LPSLVDEVARRRLVLVVTKRGKPIARVVPMDDAAAGDALSGCGDGDRGDRVETSTPGVVWEAQRR